MSVKENTQSRMEQYLKSVFQPVLLSIHNDSSKHSGHVGAGEETHFRIHIEAEAFRGKSRIERHRMVYAALENEFSQGLHALQVKATAPGE
jgi:BolA protein